VRVFGERTLRDMLRTMRTAHLLPLLLAALAVRPSVARACATAPAPGEAVHTNREDVLIVWDEARHLEHFVRSAVFDTSAKSFGFLVPTPSRPTLAEASEAVADVLGSLTAPATLHETRYVPVPVGCTMVPLLFMRSGGKAAAVEASASFVRVLEQSRVAGLDAAVLEADDPTALAEWLRGHGFEFRDALKRWVAPYLAKRWTITAFRYARPDVAANVGMFVAPIASRAVRMTFATDAPVYPYREPDDMLAVPGRELRLFVVSASRLDGSLADVGGPWSASVPFSARAESVPALAGTLPGVELPGALWINEFSDGVTQRPASDLVFRAAVSSAEVRRPPKVIYDDHSVFLPYEIPLVVGGVWWWRRRTRRRARG
jgi:hypothetical protein